MSKRLIQAAVVLVVVFAAAQLVRPERTNPPTDPSRTIRAHVADTSQLPAILGRACGECHSNNTAWPSYAQLAPVSWVLARAVAEGRNAVNYSEWGGYSPGQQRTLLHPEARLSSQDVETICGAARQVETNMAQQR